MYISLRVKYQFFLLDCNETQQRFPKNTQILNFMKIGPVGAELFHEDRRTGRHDEDNSRFRQFCEHT
jgi:hypothetical protein